MIFKLTKGHEPGRYTLGEGLMLDTENDLTERLAAEYVEAGILEPAGPSSKPELEEEEPEEGAE